MELTDRTFFLVAAAFYALGAVYAIFLWRKGFREDDRFNYLLVLAGFVFHTLTLAERGWLRERCPVNNLYEATLFAAWALGAIYLGLACSERLRFLGAFVSPLLFCLAVLALTPGLENHGPTPQFVRDWTSLHASLTLLAYGAFGLSSLAAGFYLIQVRNLKFHRLEAILARLPPVERLETIIVRLLAGGFALLTAGLAIGVLWLKYEKGVYFQRDPKLLWSVLVWFIYLGLLAGRLVLAHAGRRLAWGAIGSFGFVLLTFWGFSLLSEIHHP